MKRMLSLLLAACLLLGLAACGKGGGKRTVHKVDWVASPAYKAEDVPLPVPTGELIGCCTDGEYMYILADEETEDGVRSVLSRASLADGGAAVLEEYQPTAVPEGGFKNTLGPIMTPDGTLWLYEMLVITSAGTAEDPDGAGQPPRQETFHHLLQLDPATGRQKALTDLSDAVRTLDVSSASDISGFAVDGGGNIYFAGTGGVAVLNRGGKYLFTLEAALPNAGFDGSSGGPLALLPDGTVAVLTIQPGGQRAVRTIDVSGKTWGAEQYQLPSGIELLYGGTNGFLFYFVTGGVLYAWEPGAEEGYVLLNWADTGLSGGAMAFAPLDGGRMAVLAQSYPNGLDWYSGEIRLSTLLPLEASPTDGKVKLVYGTIGTHDIQKKRIQRFNQSSDEYYIELRNYAGDGVEIWYLTDSDREAAKKLLLAETAAGQAPDIWDTTLPLDLYARKGYLEDLWPYIDGDADIDRDSLLTHVLECASQDGKLYSVFNTFSIQTTAVSRALWGDGSGWTLEELLERRGELPEGGSVFGYGVGDVETLSYLLEPNLDDWIDWSTGACRFDSPEFKALLELCKGEGPAVSANDWDEDQAVAALDGTDLRAGLQLMRPAALRGPGDLTEIDAIFAGPEHLTDYLGYLRENGIAVSADCSFYCQMMVDATIAQVQGNYIRHPLSEKAVFGALDHGGYARYVGYPGSGGSGSGFLLPGAHSGEHDARLAISSASRHKDAAWSFVRSLLLPGALESEGSGVANLPTVHTTFQFPVYMEDFVWLTTPWYVSNKTQRGVYALGEDGTPLEDPRYSIPIPFAESREGPVPITMFVQALAPDEAQMEQFWTLYNSIDRVCTENSDLLALILEQAQPYFAGDKSLDETAALIQNRATLYVNENR